MTLDIHIDNYQTKHYNVIIGRGHQAITPIYDKLVVVILPCGRSQLMP